MKLGIATIITDEGIRPDALAKAVEDRGFDSLVVAEHSHIPADRATPYPAGGELPHEFYRSYDPFVALTAAALATSKLLIGPGVLLLPCGIHRNIRVSRARRPPPGQTTPNMPNT